MAVYHRAVQTGDHASMPDPSDPNPSLRPIKGALYSCTDHGAIHQYDGPSAGAWGDWFSPGSGPAGPTFIAAPVGLQMESASVNAPAASTAYALVVPVLSAMDLRALAVRVSSAGSGAVQWGLFDVSASATAATKVAGGSGALNATGWVEIAASSAPVSVAAGTYLLVVHWPASNVPTVYRAITTGQAHKLTKSYTSYTWDDTPDFTAVGWAAATVLLSCYLRGDIASGVAW